jgi:hypothetical protein
MYEEREGRDQRFSVTICFLGGLAFCETSLESSHNLSGEEWMCSLGRWRIQEGERF